MKASSTSLDILIMTRNVSCCALRRPDTCVDVSSCLIDDAYASWTVCLKVENRRIEKSIYIICGGHKLFREITVKTNWPPRSRIESLATGIKMAPCLLADVNYSRLEFDALFRRNPREPDSPTFALRWRHLRPKREKKRRRGNDNRKPVTEMTDRSLALLRIVWLVEIVASSCSFLNIARNYGE